MKGLLPEHAASITQLVLLVLFFIFFVGLSVWVYRRDRKPQYDALAQLPLNDE